MHFTGYLSHGLVTILAIASIGLSAPTGQKGGDLESRQPDALAADAAVPALALRNTADRNTGASVSVIQRREEETVKMPAEGSTTVANVLQVSATFRQNAGRKFAVTIQNNAAYNMVWTCFFPDGSTKSAVSEPNSNTLYYLDQTMGTGASVRVVVNKE